MMKHVDIDEPTSFLDHVCLGCTEREIIIDECTKMFESRTSSGATEKLRGGKKPRAKTVACSYGMEGHASRCTANWQTRKWSSFTRFQVLAWMIIKLSRRNSNPLENCQKCAHKLS